MRCWPPLLLVVLLGACATPANDDVVGPWLRLERANPARVSELLAIELGHRAAVADETPHLTQRPEIDAVAFAVRWRGSAAEVERAALVVPRLDVAREPDPMDSSRPVSAYVVWPGAHQAVLAESIDRTFFFRDYYGDRRRCERSPVFRCSRDPARDVMHVRGVAWAMHGLCEWLRDLR